MNSRASSIRSPNRDAATGGSGSITVVGHARGAMFHVKHHVSAGDDGVAIAAFALGLRGEAALGDDVVHDLALVARHRRQGGGGRALLDARDGAVDQGGELGGALIARSADVEDQPREAAGLVLHREAGELLQRGHRVGLRQQAEVRALRRRHRDVGAARPGVDVDVAIEVGDVEQLLDVVGGDVALVDEVLLASGSPSR